MLRDTQNRIHDKGIVLTLSYLKWAIIEFEKKCGSQEELPAGTYALFVIPSENGDWTFIFNSDYDRSGATIEGLSPADYEEKNKATDVLRLNIKPITTNDLIENLTYKITDSGFSLSWEHITLSVEIR